MQKNKPKSLKNNIIHNGFLTAISMITPILILSSISKTVGIEDFGIYATIISYTFIYIVFSDFGLTMSLTRRVALAENSNEELSALIQSFIYIRIISALVSLPLFINLFFSYVLDSYLVMLYAFLFYFTMTLNFSWFFQGKEIVSEYSQHVFFSKLILILSVYIVSYYDLGLKFYVLSQGISSTYLAIVSLAYLKKNEINFFASPNIKFIKEIIKNSLGFYFSRLTVNLYEYCSTFFVSLYLTVAETAQYALVLQIFQAGSSIISAISMSLYPYMSRTKNFIILNKVTVLFTLMLLVIYPLLDLIYPFLVAILFGEIFVSTLEYIKVIYVASVFQVSASFFGYPFFSAINKVNLAHSTMIAGSIIYLIALLVIYVYDLINIYSMILCIVFTMGIISISRSYYFYSWKR